MDHRISDASEVKSESEIYKERAFTAFACAEQAATEEIRVEYLEAAVQWLKLATEAANVQEKSAAPQATAVQKSGSDQ